MINWDAFVSAWQRAEEWKYTRPYVEFKNFKTGKAFWRSNEGPQTWALWRPEFEILSGGSRGGGKSALLKMWTVIGNHDLPMGHPCREAIFAHPEYKCLILRRNATDLEEFIDSARPFYEALGAKTVLSKPVSFEWKHGAKIYTNHLDSPEATEKYRGWSLARIAIEELTQIADIATYLKVLSSCRTPYPELRPAWSDGLGQILSTTNPDGPGSAWVKDRFVEVEYSNGGFVPWGKTRVDQVSKLTRIFIPMRLTENPHIGESYRAMLEMHAESDPALVAAWVHGVWGQHSGTFFTNFRPTGPRDGEPPEARHVIPKDSVKLMPWWSRSIGVDWGLADEAVAVWGCYNQDDGRTYVYRELVVNGNSGRTMGTEELGAEIARLSLPDLEGQNDNVMTLFLAWDCFNKTDTGKTKAEQFAWGMEKILGPASVIVAAAGADPATVARYEAIEGKARIIIRPSTRLRTDAWQYIRQMMRFTPVAPIGEPNQEYVDQLLRSDDFDKFVKIDKYLSAFRRQAEERLPRLQIFDDLPKLVKQLKDAIRDEKDPEDVAEIRTGGCHMDRISALRYLLWGMKETAESMPKWAFMDQRHKNLPAHITSDPTVLAQVMRHSESVWADQHSGGDGIARLPRLSVQ